jgi:hypothetical protein
MTMTFCGSIALIEKQYLPQKHYLGQSHLCSNGVCSKDKCSEKKFTNFVQEKYLRLKL